MTSTEFYRGRGTSPSSEPGGTPRVWPEPVPSSLRAGLTTGKVLPFRRRAVKPQRRSRSKAVRWLKPFATAVLVVGLPASALTWLVSSPRFRVAHLEIEGTDSGLVAWVRQRLGPFDGENLLVLPLSRVSRELGEHPWIEALEISKQLPDRLRVVIHERRPEALVDRGGRLFYADGSGRPIAPVAPGGTEDPAAPAGTASADAPSEAATGPAEPPAGVSAAGLLRVVGPAAVEGVPGALSIRRELVRVQPQWGTGVTEVEVLSDEDFRLHTTALPFPLLVRAGDVEPKIRDLEALLPQLLDHYGELAAVDLRFRRRIIVEPKSPRSSERGT